MRQIITLFILIAFLAQMFSKVFIVADYYLNTAAFAKNCENKARPKMHCNGKCQMMKKIKDEEKKEQENTEKKLEYKAQVLSSCSYYYTLTFFTENIHQKHIICYHTKPAIDMAYAIFHPPCA